LQRNENQDLAWIWIHSILKWYNTMTLIKVIESNNITLRPDIHAAIAFSKDQFIATQQTTMKPQLLYAAKYAQDHITEDNETVLRMDGHR
jgi:hypothetical protein